MWHLIDVLGEMEVLNPSSAVSNIENMFLPSGLWNSIGGTLEVISSDTEKILVTETYWE